MDKYLKKDPMKYRNSMPRGAGEAQPAQENAQGESAQLASAQCESSIPVRVCSCCHLSYPLTEFYRKKAGYDCYCKSCRSMRNQFRSVMNRQRNYTPILDIEDDALRLEKICELHRKINIMLVNNMHRRHEEEAEREFRYYRREKNGTR